MTIEPRTAVMAVFAWGLAVGAAAASASARASEPCPVPESVSYVGAKLPLAAARLRRDGTLRIIVIGTSSSGGTGVSEPDKAFPKRLEEELARLLAPTRIEVEVVVQRGATAEVMATRFERDVLPRKPALVIWQTGTVDATRNVDIGGFGETLENGIETLAGGGANVILVDPQFNPRLSPLVNLEPVRETMARVAEAAEIPLFRRYDAMRYWVEKDLADVSRKGRADQLKAADFVHDCVGRLLARLIVEGVREEEKRGGKP